MNNYIDFFLIADLQLLYEKDSMMYDDLERVRLNGEKENNPLIIDDAWNLHLIFSNKELKEIINLQKVNNMKKILMCLLSLGLIAGCTQQVQERPEEPPAVEEPINEDNEQDTIEYVNKIDDTKDWIYSNEGDSLNENKDIESWFFAFPNRDICPSEKVYINIDSTDADEWNTEHNSYIAADLDDYPAGTQSTTGSLCQDYEWYTVNDTLVLFYQEVFSISKMEVYLFDLKSGKQINVDELLERYGYNQSSASEFAENTLLQKNYGIQTDDLRTEEMQGLFFNTPSFGPYKSYSTFIEEGSVLFISPSGKLSLLVQITKWNPESYKDVYSFEIIEFD